MTKKALKIFEDPQEISKLSKEELVEAYEITEDVREQMEAQSKAIKDNLMAKIKTSGEIIKDFSFVKVKRVNFKVDLKQAKEYGAVKQAIDRKALKELYDRGIDIPHSITEYLLAKKVKKE